MLKITRVKISAYRFLLARKKTGNFFNYVQFGSLTAHIELKSVASGLNIQWRGRSYAASVPSDAPKSQRGRKKVSKDERKAMVEAFVKTYRAAHDGKFPTASELRKNVGGSHYVLRIMLQELEYKSRTSSPDGGTETLLGNGLIKEHKASMDAGTQNEVDNTADDNVEIGDASDKHLETEGSPLASSVTKSRSFKEVEKPTAPDGQPDLFRIQSNLMNENSKDGTHSCLGKSEPEKMEGAKESQSDFVAMESHPIKEETDKTFHQDLDTVENSKKEEAEEVPSYFVATERHLLKRENEKVSQPSVGNAEEKGEGVPSKELLESDGKKHEAKQYKGSPEPEKNATDISSRETNEAEAPKKSTLWGSLKSLADGFFRMWK
ncbi:DNA binding [Melia azedarach]|uniref:DNA binding n=1 Tax=Melia azedarach TaxID=155640 RepID=A0ACC1XS82_MELAZ|nr:DNA binding [Melia azedarach]